MVVASGGVKTPWVALNACVKRDFNFFRMERTAKVSGTVKDLALKIK